MPLCERPTAIGAEALVRRGTAGLALCIVGQRSKAIGAVSHDRHSLAMACPQQETPNLPSGQSVPARDQGLTGFAGRSRQASNKEEGPYECKAFSGYWA